RGAVGVLVWRQPGPALRSGYRATAVRDRYSALGRAGAAIGRISPLRRIDRSGAFHGSSRRMDRKDDRECIRPTPEPDESALHAWLPGIFGKREALARQPGGRVLV